MSTQVYRLHTSILDSERAGCRSRKAFCSSLDFWHEELSGALPALDLPLDRRRCSERPSEPHGEVRFTLPSDLVRQLERLAGQEGASLSSVYLAAYAILLSRHAKVPDVLIGSASTIREIPEREQLADDLANITLIQTHCAPDMSFRRLVRDLSETIEVVQQYQSVPLGALVESLDMTARTGRAGLADAWFIWEDRSGIHANASPVSPRISELKDPKSDSGAFDIALQIRALGGAVKTSFLYRKDLFERTTIEGISRHWVQLLQSIVSKPETAISGLEMMPDDERALVLGRYAGASSEYPRVCLHELFAEHARNRRDAEALVFGAERLTYRQLDERSNQIAQFLQAQGISPEDRIGIFMDRSADMIISMLGILKAGGAYVPIDPDYPAERLKFIADDTSVRLVLSQRRVNTVLPSTAPLVYVDGADSPVSACSTAPVISQSTPESIAVVIYTSGSTGQPKAACIPHRAVVRTVCKTNHIEVVMGDRVAQVASPSFDAAIMEIWLALANGATLVGMRRETLLDHRELRELIKKEHISILVLNTAHVHQLGREAPELLKGIRKVMFGGEAAEPGPLRTLLKHLGPGVLVNGYGPAEGCVITTYHEITSIPENATTVPIGRPVSNAQVYLLDDRRQPVPIGVQGEIYIGGEGVARGYLNREELTAERFIPDPFSSRPAGLLYRTGDIARMRWTGEFEFIGRVDEQVKIRGHRIELAEVRQVIDAHPDVKQVFLMVREDQPGDKRLVAYVTLQRPLPSAPELLRQHTKNKLPSHMLPASFVVVDSIPLNTNGKVDRKMLPPPHVRPDLAIVYERPTTGLECRLAQIWQELLGIENIGVNDDFFQLGGHSLLAARLIARIEKETGQKISLTALLEAPTVAKLARKLRSPVHTSEEEASLVELRAPSRPTTAAPLFCLHWQDANLVTFHKIASLLRGDRPIYGLQTKGLGGGQEPLDSLEEIASTCVDEIRKKQPRGPYYLAGICICGVLAYEIAQQLRAAGQEVRLVVLIDSYFPGTLKYLHARSDLTAYLDNHLGEILLLPAAERLKYFAKWLGRGVVRATRALGRREPDGFNIARQTEERNIRILNAYTPKPYAGRITHFICSDGPHRSYEDRRLAWSAVADGGLEVHVVPGNHFTWIEESPVRIIAQKLQRCLDRAGECADSVSEESPQESATTDSAALHGNA